MYGPSILLGAIVAALILVWGLREWIEGEGSDIDLERRSRARCRRELHKIHTERPHHIIRTADQYADRWDEEWGL